ncbi:NAD(P)H-quinone oxidoreductase subunit U, chloroplastic [Arachis stenosperma]|uniref:NAD(P)H-quinone oxidoreductase subunit U, chloroplastic n=1 Tax=Arachis stenosperma TaxID=217475 RepID=UPI0025AC1C07|nr:NAD(P)H-quinone oxidoreductase subunit U, chloroplastic [Arachis stenosperma]
MAVSTTTSATGCIRSNIIIVPTNQTQKSIISFTLLKPRRCRCCIVRTSSNDVSAEISATEQVDAETEESSIEVPEESPSLISALNVERALRGIPITDADHYGRLGIPRDFPIDKVVVAYKNKVQELEGQGLEEDELNKKLELVKESFRILSTVDERRIYDWSLARAESADTYIWPYEVDKTTLTSKEEPPAQEPENVQPTRLVGYFILGWIVVSFVASIALNL